MSQLDTIIDDVATRFGLGDKAGPLLRELLKLITGTPGGIGGFIDKFRSAGLSREVSGWLGNTSGTALSSSQIEQALGQGTIDTIARKVGLPAGAASAAIGYLAPKLIGQMTPNGVIGPNIPRSVSDFLNAPASTTVRAMPRDTSQTTGTAGWVLPLLALAALGGLGWYFLSGPASTPVATTSAPGSATTGAGPATLPSASSVASRLSIKNDNGVVTVSGTVPNQATRLSIMDTLKNVFGGNAVKGDIGVDASAAPVPWLSNLPQALAQMKTPGIEAAFEGNSLNLGGALGDADRERIMSAMRSLFGASGLTLAAADQMASLVSDSTNKATAALAALGSRFQTTDLLGILNKSIINFPTGSADIPAISRALLQQAAVPFKQLPAGTVVEISGYTDNTGDPAANVQLSQHRADAVKSALTQAGVNPATLVSKGYGSANPIASNDTAEGRFQNRRISYQISDGNRGTVGSGR